MNKNDDGITVGQDAASQLWGSEHPRIELGVSGVSLFDIIRNGPPTETQRLDWLLGWLKGQWRDAQKPTREWIDSEMRRQTE